MVDYEKTFDPIEIWAILNNLSNSRVHDRYSKLILYIYYNEWSHVTTQDKLDRITLQKGIRKGGSIPLKTFHFWPRGNISNIKMKN